eukprot:scaffold4935_cov67-Phaeocystis_antarctica.AAC.5
MGIDTKANTRAAAHPRLVICVSKRTAASAEAPSSPMPLNSRLQGMGGSERAGACQRALTQKQTLGRRRTAEDGSERGGALVSDLIVSETKGEHSGEAAHLRLVIFVSLRTAASAEAPLAPMALRSRLCKSSAREGQDGNSDTDGSNRTGPLGSHAVAFETAREGQDRNGERVGADKKANTRESVRVRGRMGTVREYRRALRESGSSFGPEVIPGKVKYPERIRERTHHGQHRRTIATEPSREIELVAFHTSRTQEPVPKIGAILTSQLDHVRPEWAPLPRRRIARQSMLPSADRANCKVLLEREVRRPHLQRLCLYQAEQWQPVLRHALAHSAQRLLGLGWQRSASDDEAQFWAQLLQLIGCEQGKGCSIELLIAKVAHLRSVRLEERRLEQVRHRGRRHRCTALLAIHALEHRLGCCLVQLGDGCWHCRVRALLALKDGDDHREHERVARDALLRLIIKGHAV